MSTRIYLQVNHAKLQSARGLLRPSDLARVLEITPQTFASYEGGVNRVPADVLIKWCAQLKLKPAAVINTDDKKLLVELTRP